MSIFGFKKKKDEVLDHWIAFAEGFNLLPSEFYAAVEKELAAMKVPGMEISKVEHAEGGLLSGKRVYLRMARERLAFDACAAPFGTGYFFSCRTVYVPPVIQLWQIILLLGFLALVYESLVRPLGVIFAAVSVAGLVVAIGFTLRNAIALGLSDVDATLIRSPIFGPIYEVCFRKETYYRFDTRLMYLDTVPRIIKRLAEDTTGAQGIRLERQYEKSPILGELYKPVTTTKKAAE